MKKNFKRWLALVLAVVLVSGTCLTHTDSFLWATDGETTETASEDVQDVANETGETDEQQTVEQQPVEEKQEVVIPKKEDAPAPEEKEQEDPVTNEKPEANQSVQDGKPADEGSDGQEVEVVPSDKKENFYNVVFHKPAVEGGTLYVWEEGKEKEEASYINGEFTKEVKEGTTLYFEIQTADNYSVEKVTDKSGEVMTPEETTENTSTYKMVVKEKNEITILYKEVKEEESTTFNVQDESDRLLGGSKAAKSYPEYLTPQEYMDGHYSSAHLDANYEGFFEIKDGKYICLNEKNYPNDYPAGKHYVSIRDDALADVIGYVRCDVYRGETTEDTYYEVIYARENGEVISRESVIENGYPKEVPKLGDGKWTLDGQEVKPAETKITKNRMTFVWHEEVVTEKVTITYEGNTTDTVNNLPESSEVEKGNDYTIAKDIPSRKGYTFEGWDTKNDGTGNRYQPNSQIKDVTNDIILYAQWKIDDTKKEEKSFFVDYYKNDNKVERETITKEVWVNATKIPVDETKDVNRDKYTADGYSFVRTEPKTLPKAIEVDGVISVYFEANIDTLTYNGNGATSGTTPTTEGKVDENVTVSDNGFVRAGYIFKGWNTNANGDGTSYQPQEKYQLTNKEDILYAQWERDTNKFEAALKPYEGKYDGIPHTVTFDKSVLQDGETLAYKNTKGEWQVQPVTYIDVTNGAVKVEVAVLDKNSTQIWSGSSTVTISPRKVTLTSATDSKPYDGTPLTNKEVTVSEDGFVEDEGATYNVTGSITNPGGPVENTFTYQLNENTKAQNYEIKTEAGTLTITDRSEEEKYQVTVTPKGGSEKYDGTPKSVNGFEGAVENGIPVVAENGITYYVTGLTAGANRTDAGTTPVEVSGAAIVKDAAGIDLTNQFKVNVEAANLVIDKRNVTLTSATASKPYDGTPLINKEVTVSGDGFAEGEGATYSVTGSQTLVGNSPNEFTYDLNEGTKADNYNITQSKGTLTVVNRDAKYEITVEAKSSTDNTYDGTNKTVSGFKTLEFTVEGQKYTVSGLDATATLKDAGTVKVPVTGTAVVKDAKGNVVTDQFAVTTKDGTLTVKPRKVTLTSASDEKVYDGTPLTNNKVEEGGDGFAEGEGATYSVTGSQTLVGKSPNKFTYTLNEGTKADNYKITKNEGELEVKDRPEADRYEITVEANSSTDNTYDGTEKTAEGLKQKTFVVNGQTYTVEGLNAKTTKTNAGTYAVEVEGTAVVKDANENDVTKQFNVKKTDGQLVIAKKAITVTADSQTREYGVPNAELTYKVDGIISTEKLEDVTKVPELTTTATVTSSPDIYPITFAKETSEAENYDITYVNGTITVTKNQNIIVIKAADDTQIYNGNALTNNKVSVQTKTMLVDGDYIESATMTDDSTITNVGTKANKIASIIIKNKAGEDVTSNYAKLDFAEGTLEVTPATIEVTADNNGKVVGQKDPELTYKVTKDSKVAGEKAAFDGKVEREKGEKTGTYGILAGSLKLIDSGAFLASNYKLSVVPGTFTIEDADYTVTKTMKNVGTGENGSFKAGEKAVFEIKVTNNSKKYAVKEVVVEDVLSGGSGRVTILPGNYTVEGTKATIAELNAGETMLINVEYEVTQSDIDNQNEITNIAKVADTSSEKVNVPTEKKNPDFTSSKELTNEGTGKDGSFKVGEIATFAIKVQNTGNVTLNNIVVKEELKGAEIVAGTDYTINEDGFAVISTLKVGTTVIVNAQYQITQTDVDNGGTNNIVTVEGKGPGTTDPETEKPDEKVPTDDKKPEAVTTKKLTNTGSGENGSFKVGETAEFDITVQNTGNVTLKDVVVKEDLKGAKIVKGDGYTVSEDGTEAIIEAIEVGATSIVKAEYVITQEDIDNGGTSNSATVDIPGKEDPQKPTEEIPTETQKPNMASNKTLTNQGTGENGAFKVGEVAEFDIVVENKGNVTLKDVTVTEELAGATIVAGPDYTVSKDGKIATIETLAVEGKVIVKAEYKITQADVDNGGAINSVTVNGEGTGGKDPEPVDPEVPIPTDPEKPALTSTKALTNKGTGTDGKFKAGDTAEFDITVQNTGNVTLNDVTVREQLSGAKIVTGKGYTVSEDGTVATIATLNVGETVVVKATYVVTQADVDNGGVKNIASVEGEGAGGKDPKPVDPEEPIPTEPQKPDFTSEKKLTNKGTGFLGKFKVGETARFDIAVENTGNVTLKNITVKEQLAGAKIVEGTGYTIDEAGVAVIETLEVGTTVVVKAEYVITQEDVDNGGVKNKVAVNGNGPDEKDPKPQPETPEEEIQTDDKKPTAITKKTLTNSGSGEGGSFKVGETAEFDITVENTGNVTLKDVVVKEMLNGAKIVAGEGYTVSADGKTATIAVIKVGETATVKAVYTMTQADVDNGEVINTADVEVPGKPDPQNPEEPIPTDPQKPEFTSTKTLENEGSGSDGSFKVGDIAKFDITVRNTGNVTLKDVKVKEQLAGAKIVKGEGYTVSADGTTATIATMEVGTTVILKAEYTITQADVDNGGAINSVTVEGEGTGGKDPEPVDPEVPIPTDPEKPALTSTKALTNEGTGTDGKFKVGDTAEFDITVQNTGNVTLNDVTVREQLSGAKIVTGKGYTVSEDGTVATIATLNVGETVVVKATYVVTQADVDNGGVKNIVSVEGEGAGGKDPEPVDPEEPIPTEPQKPEFTSEKKLTNEGTGANGKFKVGETAKFDITVENTGNVTLNNITVTEQLEGAVILAGNGYKVVDNVAVIDTLEVGTTVVVKAEYVITQADVDNGGVENTVAVEGEGSGEEKPNPQNPEEEIPTDDKKPTAITAKTLTNSGSGEGGSFKVGETAEFDITVQNTGNVTLKDVVVKEMLNGAKIVAGEGYTVSADGKSATIATIKVGETATVKAVYTMTQADVDNGQVINTADVEVPGKPDPQSPEEPIPTDPEKPAFTSTKTLTNEGTGADGTFKVGDTAEFDITVKNTGNVTLKDVTVKEQLAGAKIIAGEGYRVSFDGTAVIDTLEVGATVVVKAVYTITQADVDNGGVVNSVAVEGKGPNGEDPRPVDPQEPIPTEDPDPSMSVEKTVTSTNEVYNVGDTITYQIVVKNDGNITLHNVVVTDTLQNAAGEVTFEETEGVTFAGNTAIIDMMAPGETVTLNCSYVVTRADAGNDIMNTAVGDSDETDPTDPSVTEPSDVEDIYNLTINYVYADGRTAAPSVVAQYLAGESFGYASPTIDGYTPDYAFVRTGAEGMPARDVVVTVVYTAIPVPAPTPTPDTPDTPDTPVTPTTPDAGTTTPTDDAVGAEITTNEEGEVEVVPVIEEEVPLAKRDLDDHDCCILHFLLMLAAMIVYAAYTRSMKKRQERIAELAEELETEMLKRKQQESAE